MEYKKAPKCHSICFPLHFTIPTLHYPFTERDRTLSGASFFSNIKNNKIPLSNMKLSSILSMAALASVIEASPIEVNEVLAPTIHDSFLTAFQTRDVKCSGPGQHKCAVIVWALLFSNGLPSGTTGGRGVKVVGGNCDNIVASGSLKASGGGNGWSADFTTTYGPHLYFGANNIGIRTMSGVRFQYNGHSYTQGDCFDARGANYDAIQCNFDC